MTTQRTFVIPSRLTGCGAALLTLTLGNQCPAHHADEEVAVVHPEVGALGEGVHGVEAAFERRQPVGGTGHGCELVGGDDVPDNFRGRDGNDGQVVCPEPQRGDTEDEREDDGC